MPAPVLTPFAERLYDALAPLAYDDANQGYSLAYFCAGISAMFDQVQSYVDTDDDIPSWGTLMYPDTAPAEVLPWLGQFVGVQIPDNLTTDQQRALVKDVGGFRRGTLAALIAAAQLYLTGTKTVTVNERVGGDAYHVSVSTIDAETPSSGAVLQSMMSVKPAGIVLDYTLTAALPSYDYVKATFGAYTDLPLSYYDYNDLAGRRAVAHLAPYSTIAGRFPNYNNIVSSLASYKLLREQHV